MEQLPMFVLAVDALVIGAHWEPREGWTLSFSARRGNQAWADVVTDTYRCLSTDELAQTLCSALDVALGL